MIAIPNMDKPQSCDECVKNLDIECCGDIRNCPLIEIVHCKDCKWLGIDDGMPFCYWWLREIEPDVFCSYGEREGE
jgi:hypothetical protein